MMIPALCIVAGFALGLWAQDRRWQHHTGHRNPHAAGRAHARLDAGETDWHCPDCLFDALRVPQSSLAESGTPVCPDCDIDMEPGRRETNPSH